MPEPMHKQDQKIRYILPVLMLALSLLQAGCSGREKLLKVPVQSGHAVINNYATTPYKRSVYQFDPVNLQPKIDQQIIQQRTNNLFILVDTSVAIEAQYRGIDGYGQEILRRFNQSIPDVPLQGEIYLYGSHRARGGFCFFNSKTNSENGYTDLSDYDPQQRNDLLPNLRGERHLGDGTLASALDDLTPIVAKTPGNSAIIVVSRWEDIDTAARNAVSDLRQQVRAATVSNDLCVYSVGVGNTHSRSRLEQVDRCGFAVAADKIAQPRDMSHFVERVVFRDPNDGDGDGIYDYADRCPNTEPGRIVGFDGCNRFGDGEPKLPEPLLVPDIADSIDLNNIDYAMFDLTHEVLFDSDSSVILPIYQNHLQRLAALMLAHPQSRVYVVGHTDYQASAAYNQVLSQRRSEAVQRFLQQSGVSADRMRILYHGEFKPRRDNSTPEGRALNRRVELLLQGISGFSTERSQSPQQGAKL